jgi:hypothetical integral membrane protein (TIGR02206 family)
VYAPVLPPRRRDPPADRPGRLRGRRPGGGSVIALATPEHLGAALVTAALCAGVCTAARRRPGPWTRVVARVLGVVLVANLAVWQVLTVAGGSWSAAADLQVDLCPVTAVIAAVALWRPRPLLVELAYFWGCAGTIQGILQPDTRYHFPSYWYFEFYVTHSGVVLAALLLVVGLRLEPRPGAVPRVFAMTLGFTCLAAVADVVTGGNYMYLRDKGPAGTLLDLMGPWPWYVGTGAVLALLLLLLLDAPLRLARAARTVSTAAAAAPVAGGAAAPAGGGGRAPSG